MRVARVAKRSSWKSRCYLTCSKRARFVLRRSVPSFGENTQTTQNVFCLNPKAWNELGLFFASINNFLFFDNFTCVREQELKITSASIVLWGVFFYLLTIGNPYYIKIKLKKSIFIEKILLKTAFFLFFFSRNYRKR